MTKNLLRRVFVIAYFILGVLGINALCLNYHTIFAALFIPFIILLLFFIKVYEI